MSASNTSAAQSLPIPTTAEIVDGRRGPDSLIRYVASGWDLDNPEVSVPAVLKELLEVRQTVASEATEELADDIFKAVVSLGEQLPDMFWVHVAVECAECLRYGLVVPASGTHSRKEP